MKLVCVATCSKLMGITRKLKNIVEVTPVPGLIVRTKTAELVSELLGSREGRRHLEEHGWVQGMPIIMAVPTEPLNDVIGLASIHGRPVLIAMIDGQFEELKFLHLSTPNPALLSVEVEKDSIPIQTLFSRAEKNGLVTFRTKYCDASSVAHPIPTFHAGTEKITYSSRFSV